MSVSDENPHFDCTDESHAPPEPKGMHDKTFDQVHKFTKKSYAFIAVLSLIIAAYGYVLLKQWHTGLRITGLTVPTYWGIYIASFVYFIGLSHAGTLISAILRVTHTEWRRPITRLAESITVFVLIIGALNIITDVGRPLRAMVFLPEFGRAQSPLFWDMASVSTYIVMSFTFLWVALIPDIAHLRDKVKVGRPLYELFSLNFTGTTEEWRQFDRTMLVLSILVIPVAVSVHTVVSFIFSMTPQPLWHETVFGPFFVTGALFSGVAAIVVSMWLFRRYYNLQEYLDERMFNNMGKILLTFSIIWFYFMLAEHLTGYYGYSPHHMAPFADRVFGRYQPMFLAMIGLNFVVPVSLIVGYRTINTITVASLGVLVGMYFERYLILAPTLTNPMLPYKTPREFGLFHYVPTWPELLTIAGGFALFGLMYYLFSKFFPIIPFSEVTKEEEVALHEPDSYTNPHADYEPSFSWIPHIQKGMMAFFIFYELVVIAIILNGIRNGVIFGPMTESIRDQSMWYAMGLSLGFVPMHLANLYMITKLNLTFLRENPDED